MHTSQKRKYQLGRVLLFFGYGAKNTNWFTALVSYMRLFIYSRRVLPATRLSLVTLKFLIHITGGPRLVRILGPGKNRTSEIRTSRYYIVNFHQYEFYYIGNARNSTSTNFIPIALKIVLVEFVQVETVLVGDPLYSFSVYSRNSLRREIGCVLIILQKFRKFELFYCAQYNFCWMIRTQPISLLELFLLQESPEFSFSLQLRMISSSGEYFSCFFFLSQEVIDLEQGLPKRLVQKVLVKNVECFM